MNCRFRKATEIKPKISQQPIQTLANEEIEKVIKVCQKKSRGPELDGSISEFCLPDIYKHLYLFLLKLFRTIETEEHHQASMKPESL